MIPVFRVWTVRPLWSLASLLVEWTGCLWAVLRRDLPIPIGIEPLKQTGLALRREFPGKFALKEFFAGYGPILVGIQLPQTAHGVPGSLTFRMRLAVLHFLTIDGLVGVFIQALEDPLPLFFLKRLEALQRRKLGKGQGTVAILISLFPHFRKRSFGFITHFSRPGRLGMGGGGQCGDDDGNRDCFHGDFRFVGGALPVVFRMETPDARGSSGPVFIFLMHIHDILEKRSPSLSFEFFPPRNESAAEDLYQAIRDLEPLQPSFVSVTYGAGGTTREMTHGLVVRIKETTSIPPVPHLTCVGHSESELHAILERYAKAGVANILALRGDPPRDVPDYDWSSGDFRHAADLVRFIRAFNESGIHPDRRGFGIGVAGFPEGHPATPNRVQEMDFLKAKVEAGADYICTQLFFDNHDFLDFRDRCRLAGVEVPIIAGIMPVTSLQGMKRMAELAGGARYPAKLLRALQRVEGKPESVEEVGIHYAAQQCMELLDQGVDGIHFYTLNKSHATLKIFRSLGLGA